MTIPVIISINKDFLTEKTFITVSSYYLKNEGSFYRKRKVSVKIDEQEESFLDNNILTESGQDAVNQATQAVLKKVSRGKVVLDLNLDSSSMIIKL